MDPVYETVVAYFSVVTGGGMPAGDYFPAWMRVWSGLPFRPDLLFNAVTAAIEE
jgi:hypothetical protein